MNSNFTIVRDFFKSLLLSSQKLVLNINKLLVKFSKLQSSCPFLLLPYLPTPTKYLDNLKFLCSAFQWNQLHESFSGGRQLIIHKILKIGRFLLLFKQFINLFQLFLLLHLDIWKLQVNAFDTLQLSTLNVSYRYAEGPS